MYKINTNMCVCTYIIYVYTTQKQLCSTTYLLVVSIIVTVATAGVPTMWSLVIEVMEMLNISSSSNTLSSIIVILNEAIVDPIGNVTLYGPEL